MTDTTDATQAEILSEPHREESTDASATYRPPIERVCPACQDAANRGM